MTATATWEQFCCIVLPENNPQIIFTVKSGRPLHVHIRSWGSIVLTLLDAPTEAEFCQKFSYARKVESLE